MGAAVLGCRTHWPREWRLVLAPITMLSATEMYATPTTSRSRWRSEQMRGELYASTQGTSPVPVQIWAGAGPVPVQMWPGAGSVPVQMWPGAGKVPVQMWAGAGKVPGAGSREPSAAGSGEPVPALTCDG